MIGSISMAIFKKSFALSRHEKLSPIYISNVSSKVFDSLITKFVTDKLVSIISDVPLFWLLD